MAEYIDSYTLRRMLEETPLTDRQLAKKVGVSHGAVYRWRHGQSNPSIRNAERLADTIKEHARDQLNRARQVEEDVDDYKRIAGIGSENGGRPRVAS